MPNGRGFGFRGTSPPWPYVGRGRGGLPRCWYPGAFAAPPYQPGVVGYPFYGRAWRAPYYGGPSAPGATPYPPGMTREQELDYLREQADAIRGQLEQIEARMKELGAKEG